MKIDVEMFLSPLCSPFRNYVRSLDMDSTISVGGFEPVSRREIERQVREWKKTKKPLNAATPKGKKQ